jgi:Pentapeptide repeats (8 copies)
MRSGVGLILVGGVLLALAACGGSGTKSIGGCKIEVNTSCPNADFRGTDLSNQDLTGADLSGADFTNADLSGANLTEANLTNSRITNTNMQNTNLTRTNLSGATITGTDLTGATTCGTIRTNGTIDDTDCPPSGGTTTTTSSTTTTTPTTTGTSTTTTTTTGSTLPEIVYFNGPATAKCPQGTAQASVKLTWLTRRATIIQWKLDGQAINGPDQPGGSASFAFACAQPKHTYTLRASNTKGQYATFNVTVQRAG